jgi:hypothetical protein
VPVSSFSRSFRRSSAFCASSWVIRPCERAASGMPAKNRPTGRTAALTPRCTGPNTDCAPSRIPLNEDDR